LVPRPSDDMSYPGRPDATNSTTRRADHCTDGLGGDVERSLDRGDGASYQGSDRHGRIDVASRDRADRVDEGKQCEPERQGDARGSDGVARDDGGADAEYHEQGSSQSLGGERRDGNRLHRLSLVVAAARVGWPEMFGDWSSLAVWTACEARVM
jgi:hypothetical protein